MIALGIAMALAAAPLFWFDMDPKAGEKLLRWSGNKPSYSSQLH